MVNIWHWLKIGALRFVFCYCTLYLFNFPLFAALGIWNVPVTWLAKTLFGLEVVNVSNGSGDKTFDYVLIVWFIILSAIITLVWTLLARKQSHAKLFDWFKIFARYSLAMVMIGYGLGKIFPLQFGELNTYRLEQSFGDASPMGLLWTFMAASRTYTFFGGAAEIFAGVLLIFRRTTLLGALISAAVMTNVFVLNLSYDVPVKLFSGHLMLISLVLVSPDWQRLAQFFLPQQPAHPNPWSIRRVRIVQVLFISLMVLNAYQLLN